MRSSGGGSYGSRMSRCGLSKRRSNQPPGRRTSDGASSSDLGFCACLGAATGLRGIPGREVAQRKAREPSGVKHNIPVLDSRFGKSNEAGSEETASLSEEGYRRADCSPPEHTCVILGG